MGQTTVIFDGVSVSPFRPESPDRDYSDTDVPVGTAALICKAAQVLRNMGKNISAPDLSESDKTTKLATYKSSLTAVDTYTDPDEERKFITERTEVLNPTSIEKTEKIFAVRKFTDREAESYQNVWNVKNPDEQITLDQAKDVLRRKNGRVDSSGNIIPDPTENEAAALIVDERKNAVAQVRLNKTMYDELEASLTLTAVCNGTCTIASDKITLTDSSADFVTDEVAADDLVTVAGLTAKVLSITDLHTVVLKNPTKEITSATTYKIRRNAFAAQFDFSTQE